MSFFSVVQTQYRKLLAVLEQIQMLKNAGAKTILYADRATGLENNKYVIDGVVDIRDTITTFPTAVTLNDKGFTIVKDADQYQGVKHSTKYLEPSTEYLIVLEVSENTLTKNFTVGWDSKVFEWHNKVISAGATGTFKFTVTTLSAITSNQFISYIDYLDVNGNRIVVDSYKFYRVADLEDPLDPLNSPLPPSGVDLRGPYTYQGDVNLLTDNVQDTIIDSAAGIKVLTKAMIKAVGYGSFDRATVLKTANNVEHTIKFKARKIAGSDDCRVLVRNADDTASLVSIPAPVDDQEYTATFTPTDGAYFIRFYMNDGTNAEYQTKIYYDIVVYEGTGEPPTRTAENLEGANKVLEGAYNSPFNDTLINLAKPTITVPNMLGADGRFDDLVFDNAIPSAFGSSRVENNTFYFTPDTRYDGLLLDINPGNIRDNHTIFSIAEVMSPDSLNNIRLVLSWRSKYPDEDGNFHWVSDAMNIGTSVTSTKVQIEGATGPYTEVAVRNWHVFDLTVDDTYTIDIDDFKNQLIEAIKENGYQENFEYKVPIDLLSFSETEESGYRRNLAPNSLETIALQLDGSTNVIDVPYTEFDPTGQEDFAVGAIFKTGPTLVTGYIFMKNEDLAAPCQIGLHTSDAGLLQSRMVGASATLCGSDIIKPDTWYKVLVARINNQLICKINGSEVYRVTNTQALTSYPNFKIGARSSAVDGSTTSYHFNGLISRLSFIYNGANGLVEAVVDEAFNKMCEDYFLETGETWIDFAKRFGAKMLLAPDMSNGQEDNAYKHYGADFYTEDFSVSSTAAMEVLSETSLKVANTGGFYTSCSFEKDIDSMVEHTVTFKARILSGADSPRVVIRDLADTTDIAELVVAEDDVEQTLTFDPIDMGYKVVFRANHADNNPQEKFYYDFKVYKSSEGVTVTETKGAYNTPFNNRLANLVDPLSDNLVVNPSGAVDTSNWQSTSVHLVLSNESPTFGTDGLKVDSPASQTNIEAYVYQDITVTPNTEHTFSLKIGRETDSLGGGLVYAKIVDPTNISTVLATVSTSLKGEWIDLIASFNSGDRDTLRVMLYYHEVESVVASRPCFFRDINVSEGRKAALINFDETAESGYSITVSPNGKSAIVLNFEGINDYVKSKWNMPKPKAVSIIFKMNELDATYIAQLYSRTVIQIHMPSLRTEVDGVIKWRVDTTDLILPTPHALYDWIETTLIFNSDTSVDVWMNGELVLENQTVNNISALPDPEYVWLLAGNPSPADDPVLFTKGSLVKFMTFDNNDPLEIRYTVDKVMSQYIDGQFFIGDQTNLRQAYSLRQLYKDSTKSIRVRRASDDAEQDIGYIMGELDVPSLESFLGASDGYVSVFYNQSDNGATKNLTKTTNSAQPRIAVGGVVTLRNGKPFIDFEPGGTDLVGGTPSRLDSNIPITHPYMVSAVVDLKDANYNTLYRGNSNATDYIRSFGGNSRWQFNLDNMSIYNTQQNFEVDRVMSLGAYANGANSELWVNNTVDVGEVGVRDLDEFWLGYSFNGYVSEAIILNEPKDYELLRQSQKSYYKIAEN